MKGDGHYDEWNDNIRLAGRAGKAFPDNESMDFPVAGSMENRDGRAPAARPPQCRFQRRKEKD